MSATAIKLPDHMGVWDDSGETIWLPREHYHSRWDAIKFAMGEWGAGFLEVRCLSRYMRYTPHVFEPFELDGRKDPGYTEDLWTECSGNDVGAFRVWRLESR